MTDTSHDLSPVKRALLALQEMQAKLDAIERARAEPIAIIGFSCRLPGADDPEAFWRLLRGGEDATCEVPAERWSAEAFYDPSPDATGKMYVRRAGFLKAIDRFDAAFFGLTPREAAGMDPQQRLLLETTWEALERAGLAPDSLSGSRTGVFTGLMTQDYGQQLFRALDELDAYASLGCAHNMAAGRIAYLLGLHGPALVVDTACSSALVAAHLAAQSLRQRECDLALVGAANLIVSPRIMLSYCRLRALSPAGVCKTFDASADGYGRGEGGGTFVLKRLSDALRDNDSVWAVIRGSAVNHDGRSNGLTAPNRAAQELLLRQALENASLRPEDVSFVEAHGTATPLGDPIEVGALATVFGGARRETPLRLGAVKTNVGHLEAAAGVAGLLKVVLALAHEELPPTIHLTRTNPDLPLEQIPAVIPTAVEPWPRSEQARIAGLSAFGLSGTNAHLLVAEPPPRDLDVDKDAGPHLLCISARDGALLPGLVAAFADRLEALPPEQWPAAAQTSREGRSHFAHRLTVVAGSAREAAEHLRTFLAHGEAPQVRIADAGRKPPRIAFLYTGTGAQRHGMGTELMAEPAFRDAFERCAALFAPLLDQPLASLVAAQDEALLHRIEYAQPALFAFEYAMTALWRSFGVEPDAVLGHSLGEYVAACAAGALRLEDAVKLVALRGDLLRRAGGGEMLAVQVSEAGARRALRECPGVTLAAVNSPEDVVLSGPAPSLAALALRFEAEGVKTRRLAISAAAHSPHVEPVLPELEVALATVTFQAPGVPLVSNLTGTWAEAAPTARYWARHMREPVQFHAGLSALADRKIDVLLEVGPDPVLLGLASRARTGDGMLRVPSSRRQQPERETLLEALALLHGRGVRIRWEATRRQRRTPVVLPTAAFARQRHWLDAAGADSTGAAADTAAPPRRYRMRWIPAPADDTEAPPLGRWLIVDAPAAPIEDRLAALIAARGGIAERVPARPHRTAAEWAALLAAGPWQGLLFCAGAEAADEPTDEHLALGTASLLTLGQALLAHADAAVERLWIVTCGAQAPFEGAPVAPAHAPMLGLAKALALEVPAQAITCADLPPAPDDLALEALARLLGAPRVEPALCLRDRRLLVPRLRAAGATPREAAPPAIRADATYLVTGGLTGIGLALAEALARRGARRLVLMGRRAPGPETERTLARIHATGAEAVVLRGDVASEADVQAAVARAHSAARPLRGVFHAAGVLDDGMLPQQTWERFVAVLAPKVKGAWNLHRITHGLALDHFVMFGSFAAVVGSPGQSSYVAANEHLGALAFHRRHAGLPALTVDWGFWAGTGLARTSRYVNALGEASFAGLRSFSPEAGLGALFECMRGGTARESVVVVDWAALAAEAPAALRDLPLLSELAARRPPDAPADAPFGAGLPPDQRRARMTELIQAGVARVTGRARGADIATDEGFFAMGLDSLMAMDLRAWLENKLGLKIPPATVFNHATVDALAMHLLSRMFGDAAPPVEPATAPVDRDALVREVQALSDHEMESFIAAELERALR